MLYLIVGYVCAMNTKEKFLLTRVCPSVENPYLRKTTSHIKINKTQVTEYEDDPPIVPSHLAIHSCRPSECVPAQPQVHSLTMHLRPWYKRCLP